MKTETLILAGEGYNLAIAPEAEQLKAELIASAATITRVSGPDENDTARRAIKALASMRNAVEKSRNIVKAPVLDVGRMIDLKAKVFVAEIDAEEKRLAGLVGSYAEVVEAERRKVLREMEEKRQAEEKARREAEAARIKAEQEAEAARIAAERAMWESSDEAAEAKAEEARKAAEAAAERARQEEAARAAEAARVATVVPAKAEGVKFEYDFEVESIDALYRYSPGLVKMEAKRSEVLDAIKRQAMEGMTPAIPGLRITQKAKVSTR